MTWLYEQSTGDLLHEGKKVAVGYAGMGDGKNNADAQDRHNVGPLPRGRYTINAPVNTETHGPYVMRLTPNPENAMAGRAGFLIHGDNSTHTASEGCMIFARTIREMIWTSGDRDLQVVR